MNITYKQYIEEVLNLAQLATEEAKEYEQDIHDTIHEIVDGHQWIIYYAYSDDVLKHSDNSDAMADNIGNEEMGRVVSEDGIDTLKTQMAYFAMYQDISDSIEVEA